MEQVAEQSYADFSEEDLFSNLDKATRQEILDIARCYEEKNAWQEEVLKTLADGEMWTDFRSHLSVVMKLQGLSYLCNPYTLKRMSVKEACMGMVDLFIAEHYETQIMDPDRFYGVLCDGLEKAFGLRRI